MRWYEVNSEQLDSITDAMMAYQSHLLSSVESAKQAGLVRQYDMQTERLRAAKAAIDHIADIRRMES